MAEQTAAQQEYDYWNNVKTLLNRQDVNTTEQITEEQPADANLSVAENETLQPRQTVEETTAAKQEEQQQYPTDEAGEPLWYEMTEKQFDVAMTELGDDADAFIADNIKEAQKAIKKAEKAKPKSTEFAKRKAEQQAISAEKAAAQKAYDYWTAQQARRSENAQSENIIENEIDKKEEILNLQQTYENNVRQTESTNRGKLQSETPQSDRSRKQRTSQISQSIPQREFRTQDEGNRRMAQAESAIRRGKSDRNNETQLSGSESAISGLEKEQREAEAYAKANGIWMPYTELSELGYPSLSGNENENYTGEDGYIYKVNNLQNSRGILSLFNRINLHNEIFPETSYTFIGRTQPIKRPDYWIAAQTADKNSITVLEVNKGKDNVEIVGWRRIDAKGIEKLKRQAEREGGQFLILTSKGAAAALSALPFVMSFNSKDSK